MSITPFFLAQVTAPSAGQPPGVGGMLVPMVCIFAIMYFLMIRPQQKKEKQLRELIESIKTGDAVITNGGIHGVVSNVTDGGTLMLKVADNVRIKIEKSSISTVLKEPALEKA
ncbi:MAG: preprotein translocase subunit YajC [Verrucomicrobia bacterium]|nr:preprotein translocase subunit YajC [Verrucomicrobiota bacterium]